MSCQMFSIIKNLVLTQVNFKLQHILSQLELQAVQVSDVAHGPLFMCLLNGSKGPFITSLTWNSGPINKHAFTNYDYTAIKLRNWKWARHFFTFVLNKLICSGKRTKCPPPCCCFPLFDEGDSQTNLFHVMGTLSDVQGQVGDLLKPPVILKGEEVQGLCLTAVENTRQPATFTSTCRFYKTVVLKDSDVRLTWIERFLLNQMKLNVSCNIIMGMN